MSTCQLYAVQPTGLESVAAAAGECGTTIVMGDSSLIVGVDVGGTYTDAVCLQGDRVLGVAKEPTTQDVTGGVKHAIGSLVRALRKQGQPTTFRQVNIGTTHFLNAVIQRRQLARVAILRLCGSASRALEPCIEFPDDLKQVVYDSHFFLSGGFNYDGHIITPLDPDEVLRCIDDLKARRVTDIVVSCVFAPVNGDQEKEVKNLLNTHYPEASITLSHQVGQMGLLERENAAILNQCLKPLCRDTIHALRRALGELEIRCPFFMTQNDGTIISSDLALEFPVRTFSSGPTNSIRGAAHLSGIRHNAVVIDIGGTSTDVGYLLNGFPRKSSSRSYIAGVATNFRIPDVPSIGLGGGSLITGEGPENISVGPKSVGYRLLTEGLIFGGNTLTATDIAVAAGLTKIEGDTEKIRQIPEAVVTSAVQKIHQMVEDVIDQIKMSGDDVPVIVVGGGSILIDENRGLRGASRPIMPPHYQSANAVGACLSQVSGTVDYMVNVGEMSRDVAMRNAEENARRLAVRNGADIDTIEIIERQSVALAYLPGNAIRIIVKAVGNLAQSQIERAGNMGPVASDVDERPPSTEETDASQESQLVAGGAGGTTQREPQLDEEDDSARGGDALADYRPTIDPDTGEWILTERDVEYISLGAGLLGSGGGGSPHMGRLRALNQLRNGKRIRIIAPERLGSTPALSGKVVAVAFMGAPAVLVEKLISGTEVPRAITCVQDVLTANPVDVRAQAASLGDDEEANRGLVFVKNYTKCCQAASPTDGISAIMSAEIGGLNSMEPLVAGADLDLPILDCDGMGRAFPELQMFLPAIHNKPLYPCALVSDGSQESVIAEAATSLQVENCFRQVVGLQMGCSGALVLAPLSREDVFTSTVPLSYSRTWHLGRVAMAAQGTDTGPVAAIVEASNGRLLLIGKITNVTRETTGGFDKGYITVEGSGEHDGTSLLVCFQNENLVAKQTTTVDGEQRENIVATTPDIIVVTDADKGHPIPTEEVQYGLRVAVIAMPSPPALRSPEALNVVGPRAFNYETEFVSVGDYVAPTPVPPRP